MTKAAAQGPLGEFGVRIQMDPVELAKFIQSPGGPVFRQMVNLGELVKQEAQRRVGVYKPDGADPFAARRLARRPSGTLRDSIVKRVARDPDGTPVVLVGSDDPIALLHHEGTSAHPIIARRKPRLVFWSSKLQRIVRVRAVRHPGTAPNRYLTDALKVLPKQ